MALFCVLVSIIVVVIILLIAVIANWKEGSYNIIIYLVFWWGHSWEFHLVFWWGGSWEFYWVFCWWHYCNLAAGCCRIEGYSRRVVWVFIHV